MSLSACSMRSGSAGARRPTAMPAMIFSDIRSAFAVMRDALGLSAASPEAAPG